MINFVTLIGYLAFSIAFSRCHILIVFTLSYFNRFNNF